MGALFLLGPLIPNLFWTRRKPRGYGPFRESRRLVVLERAGQVWVSGGVLLSRGAAWRPWSGWSRYCFRIKNSEIIHLAGAALMALCGYWRVRYFQSPRTTADPAGGGVFLLAVYGRAS